MTPRSRRLIALSATAAIAAAVAVGSPGALPTAPSEAEAAPRPATSSPRHASASPAAQEVRGGRQLSPAQREAAATRQDAATSPRTSSDPAPAVAPARTAPTTTVLDRDRRGEDAVRALGDRVDEVAEQNEMGRQELVDLLREDDSAWVAPEGRVFYEEAMPAVAAGPLTGTVTSSNVDTSKTFALHSRPGAARSIVLDVDGADVRGTAWNIEKKLTNQAWPGWDSDGRPSTWTSLEHAWVQEVWRQVAELYAPFDVDVTTDSSDDTVWQRASDSDTAYGTRVVITSSATPASVLCASKCVGQAWNGTFGRSDSPTYQPAWVFAAPDAKGQAMSPLVAAQTAAHEVGHTLGLKHDGISDGRAVPEYYEGTTTWGPLMGAAMTRGVTQWSKGEYAKATQREDDLAIIGTKLQHVPDEAGDGASTASALPTAPAYDVSGVISTRTDADVYRLDLACPTALAARATGVGAQSALDLRLDLLGPDGTTGITSSAPTSKLLTWPSTMTGMDASLTRTVGPGTVYLKVDGVGTGLATNAGLGWSDYGSLGRYRLQADAPCATASTPTTSPSPTPTPSPVVMTRPGAPAIGYASSGASGGTVSATARWTAPRVTGGQAVLGYKVRAYKLDSRNRVVRTYTTGRTAANVRTLVYRLPRGRYTFVVTAENGLGASPWSSRSRIVTAR